MGQQQSKDELLYHQVNYDNIDKSLCSNGASLEWVDKKGKMPLILAYMNRELYNVAKTLIQLGANVNAYRPVYMLQEQEAHVAEMERTFIAIKPNGVQRGLISEIISRFEQKGFKLVGIKKLVPSKGFAQKHYYDLKERPFFNGMCDFLRLRLYSVFSQLHFDYITSRSIS